MEPAGFVDMPETVGGLAATVLTAPFLAAGKEKFPEEQVVNLQLDALAQKSRIGTQQAPQSFNVFRPEEPRPCGRAKATIEFDVWQLKFPHPVLPAKLEKIGDGVNIVAKWGQQQGRLVALAPENRQGPAQGGVIRLTGGEKGPDIQEQNPNRLTDRQQVQFLVTAVADQKGLTTAGSQNGEDFPDSWMKKGTLLKGCKKNSGRTESSGHMNRVFRVQRTVFSVQIPRHPQGGVKQIDRHGGLPHTTGSVPLGTDATGGQKNGGSLAAPLVFSRDER
jgi:hypothetical protein